MKVPSFSLPKHRSVTIAIVVAGVVSMALMSWYATAVVPDGNWFFTGHYACHFCDIDSRIRDVLTVKNGGVLYTSIDHREYFTYPTAALFLFWPLIWFSHFWAVTGWNFLTLLCYAGLVALGWRHVRGTLTWRTLGVSMMATTLGVMIFPTMALCLAMGQTASMLAIMVALDYLAIRGRGRGVLTGIAAAIKLYPALVVLVWLYRRQWREAFTAIGSAVATTLLAWIIWPRHSWDFFHRMLSGREVSHFHAKIHWRSTSSSPYSFFFRPPFNGSAWESTLGMLTLIAVALFSVWLAARLWKRGYPLSSLVVVVMGSTLSAPVVWDHYFVWVLLLPLVALEVGFKSPAGLAALWSTILLMVPWGLARDENFSDIGFTPTTVFIFFVRNALLFGSLLILATLAKVPERTTTELTAPQSN